MPFRFWLESNEVMMDPNGSAGYDHQEAKPNGL